MHAAHRMAPRVYFPCSNDLTFSLIFAHHNAINNHCLMTEGQQLGIRAWGTPKWVLYLAHHTHAFVAGPNPVSKLFVSRGLISGNQALRCRGKIQLEKSVLPHRRVVHGLQLRETSHANRPTFVGLVVPARTARHARFFKLTTATRISTAPCTQQQPYKSTTGVQMEADHQLSWS